MLATTAIHRDVAVCTVTFIVCYTMLAVMRSRSVMVHSWSVVMYCGLVHVSIV